MKQNYAKGNQTMSLNMRYYEEPTNTAIKPLWEEMKLKKKQKKKGEEGLEKKRLTGDAAKAKLICPISSW